jgi:hypothetical protein
MVNSVCSKPAVQQSQEVGMHAACFRYKSVASERRGASVQMAGEQTGAHRTPIAGEVSHMSQDHPYEQLVAKTRQGIAGAADDGLWKASTGTAAFSAAPASSCAVRRARRRDSTTTCITATSGARDFRESSADLPDLRNR